MFRRSRLSVKPNVKVPAGCRGGPVPVDSVAPQSAPAQSTPCPPPAHENESPPCDSQQQPIEEASSSPNVQREGKIDGVGNASESSKPSSVILQRRKRISTVPIIAKPRASFPSTLQLDTKVSKVSQSPPPALPPSSSTLFDNEVHEPAKHTQSVSPKKRGINKPSGVQHAILPEKKTPVPQIPQFSPFKKSATKDVSINSSKEHGSLQKDCPSPLKERPTQEGSQQEETAASSKVASKEVQHQSDRERIAKAQKLRELLKKELKKEKRHWKEKHPTLESTTPPDHSSMTMRDFIYYLPDTNPMKSAIDQEKKSEKNPPTQIQVKEPEEKNTLEAEEEVEEVEDEESKGGALVVPRVKVAEDGTIILDEESLTVEVLRAKGPIVEENDPIFERGSTTTYSSFRKSSYSKPWSNKETDMFFLAISMVGTDFSMIGQLFPHRARIEIKNKFKREERANGWRIDKAFKEKRPFDFSFFAKLLEKVLAEEKKRKEKSVKSKTSPEKKTPKARRKKGKVTGGEATNNSKVIEAANISSSEGDARIEEKENEGSLNVPEGPPVSESASTKKKKKKKKFSDFSEPVPNPVADNIPPESSKAQRSRKKSKVTSGEATNTSKVIEVANISSSEGDVRTEEKDNEGSLNIQEGPPISESASTKKKKKKNISDFSEPVPNPVADNIPPESSKAQRSGKKSKVISGEATNTSKVIEVANISSSEGDARTEEKDNEGSLNIQEGPPVSESASTKKKKKKNISDFSEPVPNPVADNIPPDSSNAQRSSKKSKIKSLEESGASTVDSTSHKGQSERASSRRSGEEVLLGGGPPECPSPASEEAEKDSDGLSRCSDQAESGKSVRGVQSHQQSPSPYLTKQSRKNEAADLKKAEGNTSPAGTTEKISVAGVVSSSETMQEKMLSNDIKDQESRSSSAQNFIIMDERNSMAIKPVPLTRGRFQKPKPNLGKAFGKKVTVATEEEITAPRKEDGVGEKKSLSTAPEVTNDRGQSTETPLHSSRSQLYHEEKYSAAPSKPHENDGQAGVMNSPGNRNKAAVEHPSSIEMSITAEKTKTVDINPIPRRGRVQKPKPNLSNTTEIGPVAEEEMAEMEKQELPLEEDPSISKSSKVESPSTCYQINLHQEFNSSTSLQSPFECVDDTTDRKPQLELVKTQTLAETTRSVDFQEDNNPQPLKSTTGGRLQKPKPHIEKNPARKKVPVIENELVENTESKKHEDDLMIIDSTNSDVETSEDSTSNCRKCEQYQSDLEAVVQIKKDKSSNTKTPAQNFFGGSNEKEQDHPDCFKEPSPKQPSKYDQDATCLEEHTQPQILKLAQLRRGRFQKPKPNLGRTAGRKSSSATENTTLEKPGEEKSEKVDQHDGSKCKTQPTLVTPDSEDQQMSSSKPLISKTYEEEELPNLPQQSSLLEQVLLPDLSECTTEKENRAASEITEKAAGVHESPNLDLDLQEKKKTEVVNSAFLRRGRLQRPKPNIVRAVGRKDVPISQESCGEVGTEAENAKDTGKQLDELRNRHCIQNTTIQCKPVPEPSVELYNDISEKSTLSQESIESSNKLAGSKNVDEKDDSSSVHPKVQDSHLVVSSTSMLPSYEDGKRDVLSPTQQVRGRLLRPRPNLVRAIDRKVTQLASFKDTNEVQVPLASAQQITSINISSVSEAEASGNTDSATSCLSQGEAVDSFKTILPIAHDLFAGVNVPETSSRPAEKEDNLLPANVHDRVIDKETSSHTQDTIKPATLLRRRSQKPKPNLARSTTSSKEHTDKEKDKETPILRDMQSEQHAYSQQNPGSSGLEREVDKRKRSFDDDKEVSEVSPKRNRRSSAQTPKSPMQHRADKEETKISQPTSSLKATIDNPLRLRKQDKLVVPLKSTLQQKLVETPCDAARGEKGKTCQKRKQNITKNSKSFRGKSFGKERSAPKTMLVTLRASVQDDEEEDDEADADIDYEEANDVLPPEEINRAPVFVPKGLRSPNPVPVNVEETMEEFDMSINVSDSHCFTDVDHPPSNTNVIKEGNGVFTIENLGTLQNNVIQERCTDEGQETVDVSTEAALALLAIGDPALQARLSTQEMSCHGEKKYKTITLENQHYIETKVIHYDPVCVSSITDEKVSAFEKQSIALQDSGSTDKRLELKEDNNSSVENSNSDMKVVGPQKTFRSRFPKPKPNIGKASSIKRNGHQKPATVAVVPMDQAPNAEGAHPDGTVVLQNIGPQSDQSITGKTGTSDLNDISPETSTDKQVHQTNRCVSQGEDICEFTQIRTMQQESVTPPQYSSSQNSESSHSVQNMGQLAIISGTYKKQKEENQLEKSQCQNISITSTAKPAATNLNSSGSSVEEPTIILTLVEIPSPSVDGYHEETTPSILQDLLPAPVVLATVDTDMLDVTQASSTETLKAAADTEISSHTGDQHRPAELYIESNKPAPNRKLRKREANVQEINVDELPVKKILLHTFQNDSSKNICKAPKQDIGNLVETMPQGSPITPNNAGSRFSSLELNDPLSANHSRRISKMHCEEGIVASKRHVIVSSAEKRNVSDRKNKPSDLLEMTASSSKNTNTRFLLKYQPSRKERKTAQALKSRSVRRSQRTFLNIFLVTFLWR
ncbi:transcription factor TFIIIB component B'' homolog isoform X2 [Pleurodeles waltl]|uniref:transcription factor TFIIIB component B'' homolog isoform X2 n=1 Tax=Pleurodeles waltl TaxID=8319 RepID=UPI0037093BE5